MTETVTINELIQMNAVNGKQYFSFHASLSSTTILNTDNNNKSYKCSIDENFCTLGKVSSEEPRDGIRSLNIEVSGATQILIFELRLKILYTAH